MPKQIALYGIEHGGSVEIFPGLGMDVFVRPSTELKINLMKLSKGATVGIEVSEELYKDGKLAESVSVNGNSLTIKPSVNYYWQTILDTIKSLHLKPVFLDDISLIREYFSKQIRLHDIKDKLDALIEEDPKLLSPESLDFKRELYSTSVLATHIQTIQREEKLLQRIAGCQPDLVICGRGHSEPFIATQRSGLSTNEFRFHPYYVETFDRTTTFVDILPVGSENYPIFPDVIRNPSPDAQLLAQRKSTLRRYSALSARRIDSMLKPKFVGTWDTDIPEAGLFEVIPELSGKGKIKGIIEDVFGGARFEGDITHKKVTFTKQYDPLAISVGASPSPVLFVGTSRDGRYEGTYSGHSVHEGKFWLEPFKN